METYQLLRQIDYLRTSIDNLTREATWFLAQGTSGMYDPISIVKVEETIESLFRGQIKRIDGVASTLHTYSEIHKQPPGR